MSPIQKCRLVGLCMAVALACLLGVFTIMDAASAHANQGELFFPDSINQPHIVISPTELQATLHPDELLTQTVWITNTGDSDLTFTIYEMTRSERLGSSANPASLPGITFEAVSGPEVDLEVKSQVADQGIVSAIIFLREKPDLSAAHLIPDQDGRVKYVYDHLLETASHSSWMFDWLEAQGANPRRLLTANAIAATLNASQLERLAGYPQVRQISLDHQRSIIQADPTPPLQPWGPVIPSSQPNTVEWNIAKIRADQTWSDLGITGEGAVVGILDTGVEYDHPALVNSYRGNLGGGLFDHNYNWFDFITGALVPYDPIGHGTMGAGIVSGDDGAENQIGVAPGANWIAVRACDMGCTDVDLLAALDWMLAPTRLDGTGADPTKAPNIVLGMWGGGGCSTFFEEPLQALVAAGIIPVFPPGGSGPTCSSVGSPADLGETLAAGATDENDIIASFSSRGPVACHPGLIKPDLTAPGVNIRTSIPGGSYAITSGTSWSAAHLAGAIAMVLSADPNLSMIDVEGILFSSAVCLYSDGCGGDICPGANYVYGHGRIDVFQAVLAALGNPPQIELPWLSEIPESATLAAGEGMLIQVTYDSSGLEAGTYMGGVGILSDDPDLPFISVPVTLEVVNQPAPVIVIDPLSFSATLPMDGILTETLTISNQGDAALTFSISEVSSTGHLVGNPVELDIADSFLQDSKIVVEPDVYNQLLFLNRSRLIICLRGQPDLSAASEIVDRSTRVRYVYDQLVKNAAQGDDLYSWLLSEGAQPRRLLTANAMAATLNAIQLEEVLSYPQVARVGVNTLVNILPAEPAHWNWLQSPASSPNTVEWNIARIRADQVWSEFGIRGEGAVVGVVEAGVMYTHPALNTQYRGNLGGGSYDHNYNWIDFIHGDLSPNDETGQGTFGAGIAVGDDGADNQIGVAPGAKWIAARACFIDGCTPEALHASLQWMLAPTDLNEQNPDPSKAPQVVLSMWGNYGCDHSFDTDIDALVAANILPVFSPIGAGPACGTVASPASNLGTLTAGATDANDSIAPFSAKGPSCYAGGIKPDVVAPGVEIRSSDSTYGYAVYSGTSYSSAHLAGAAALLFSADPSISLDQLKQALFDTAVCHDAGLVCTGDEACPGPNNTYGYGRIDVYEAVRALIDHSYDIPWLNETPFTGTVDPGESITISVTYNAAVLEPGTYSGGIVIESNDPQAPFSMLPITMTVAVPCEPITGLSMSINPLEPVVGEVITFTADASGTLPIIFTWSFGDGTTGGGEVVTHAYANAGLYLGYLEAENGCDTQSNDFEIFVGNLIKQFLLPLVSR